MIVRPVIERGLIQPILRSPLGSPFERRRGGAVPAFDPVSVFGADLVTWYGNSVDDLWRAQSSGGPVTLYQDSAGTTPVTAVGQSVGRVVDLSGNGYHLTQSTATARMLLQTDGTSAYLAADGSDDAYSTASIDLSSTAAVSAIGTVLKNSDAAMGCFFEFGPTVAANNGSFAVLNPPASSFTGVGFQYKGNSSLRSINNNTFPSPLTAVLDIHANIAGPYLEGFVNGVSAGSTITSTGTGNYGNFSLFVGSRNLASARLNGRIYALPMIVKRLMTAGERADAQKAFGKSIGVLQ